MGCLFYPSGARTDAHATISPRVGNRRRKPTRPTSETPDTGDTGHHFVGLEVDVAVDGEARPVAVNVSKSVGVIFANVAALTGVSVGDLYAAMLTTSADAFATVLPAVAARSTQH